MPEVGNEGRAEWYEVRVRIDGPRPPYREVVEHLWGVGVAAESNGNSASPDDPHWTELMTERRQPPWEWVDIDPVSQTPLVLKVVASSQPLAQRAAEFLRDRTSGRLIEP